MRFARSILVAGQLALTTVLLVGAGLFSQSFLHLQRARLGFDPDRVFTSQLSLVRNPPIAVRWDFYQRLLSAIESSPGIVSASISTRTPLTPGSYQNIGIVAAQASTLPVGNVIATDWRSVSPHYFDSLRIPLLSGRTFSEEDLPNAGIGSAILNQSLANRLYPATDPHGRLITLENRKTYRIVGVVGDTLNTEITAPPPPTLYLSATQEQRPTMFFAIRTRGKPETALPILKECLKALDPKQALAFSRPLSDWVDRATEQPRLQMWLFGAFSTIALILAAIGIYGVISYSVSQRTAEIGVRMAVGASTGDIVRMVLGQASRVVAPGLAAGVGGALAMSQLLSGFLYGIQPRDPATLLMAPLVLGTLVSWSGDSGHPNRSCPRFTKLARDGPSG